MNWPPSGFHNTPVTRAVVVASAGLSLLLGFQSGGRLFSLSYEELILKGQLWRLVTSNFIFTSSPEIVFGLYLVYFFRILERQIGSNKYAAFASVCTVIATLLQASLLIILRGQPLALKPGPYGLIFACAVPFFFDIPVSSRFLVFNLHLTNKVFVYLALLQLLASSGRQSLIPGVCGLLAGLTYRSNIFGIRRWKYPDFIVSLAAQIFSPLLSRPRLNGAPAAVPTPGLAAGRVGPGAGTPQLGASQGYADRLVGGGGPVGLQPFGGQAAAAPPEATIETLVAMGFDRDRAIRALQLSNNDATMATTLLVENALI